LDFLRLGSVGLRRCEAVTAGEKIVLTRSDPTVHTRR